MSRNPKFKSFRIDENKLCDNDENMMIILQLLNFKENGKHDIIGEVEFSLRGLARTNTYPVMKNQRQVDNCRVLFEKVERIKVFAFTDFIMGSLEIQLITCIDFTGSNGIATRP